MPEPANRPHRSSPITKVAAFVAAISLLLTQLPATAFADHGGRGIGSLLACDRPVTPPRCTSVGDDIRHHVALDASITPELAAALRRAMTDAYGATDLIVVEDRAVLPRTDVIAFAGDFGDNGAAAWVYCPKDAPQGLNAVGDRWCRHQELYFNLNPRFAAFFDDGPSREHVACHELGHTVGLRHWGNPPHSTGPVAATCMNANTPDGPTALHEIDIEHINAYPYRTPRRTRGPSLWVVQAPAPPMASARTTGTLMGASEVEPMQSVEQLVQSADLVVRGRVTGVEAGRAFGPPTHRLTYAAVSVEVLDTVAGRASARQTLTLELPLLDGRASLEALQGRMLGSERLLFLRDKGTSAAAAGLPLADRLAERGFHRLVTFGSELISDAGLAVVPPDEWGVLEPFAGIPFDEAVERVRAMTNR